MQLYVYDKDTHEYRGEMRAIRDPQASAIQGKDVFFLPPFTTFIQPMTIQKGKVPVYNTFKQIWELVEDHRGLAVYGANGEQIVIVALGPIPKGYTLSKPYSIHERKLELTEQLNNEFEKLKESIINVEGVKISVSDTSIANLIERCLENYIIYSSVDSSCEIIEKEKAERICHFLYVYNIVAALKKNEILNEIRQATSKEQVEKISISFNIMDTVKELASLTNEEFNNYIKEKAQCQ